MNRLLLALLALLTGLVAPVAPVQARIGSAEVGAVESMQLAGKVCAAVASGNEAPACRIDRRDRATARTRPVRPRVFIPSVYFGPDRAFE